MTGTAYTKRPQADTLLHRASDTGYRIGWKHKYEFQRGHFDEEMTYAEAKKKAEELQRQEPDKVFWPEIIRA